LVSSRHRWIRAACAAVLLVVMWWLPTHAHAGGVLNNAFGIPRAEDGNGVKVGERTTFHGGFALASGVDSNVYHQDKNDEGGPVVAGFIWPSAWLGIGNRQIRDGLLMTPAERSGRIMDYNISVLGGFRQYLQQLAVVRQAPRFSIGGQIRLALLPGRKFSAHVDQDVFYGSSPSNYVTSGRDFNFNRLDLRGQYAFYLRPGGGRFSLGLGYRLQVLRFLQPELYRSNRIVHGLMHETKWRFLPRSSIVLSYTMDFTYYTNCCATTGTGRKEDNYAHRLLVGYRGQAFKKFAFELMVGWGGAFYRQDKIGPDSTFNSFIGNAGVSYFPTLRSLVHVGLFRNYQDALFGNYYVDNGGRIAFEHEFRWRMIGSIGASVASRRYKGLPVPSEEDNRIEDYEGNDETQLEIHSAVITGAVKVEQKLGKIFSIAAGYNLYVDTADFAVVYTNGSTDYLGYVKHLAMVLLSVRI
jgi:hypothetical protein